MRDEMKRRVAELGEIMRRDGGCHADRNALRAIGEQVRQGGGQDDRLLLVARIIVAEIDRILVDAFEQKPRDIGHPRFGVAIGGGAIAIDIAEIALAVDERIARGKILGEADERVIDRLIAMRMERAHHVADDLRAFLEGGAGIEPQNMHAIEDAPVHRLQPVAGIGQGPAHDGRERIGEITLFERLAQIDVFGLSARRKRRRHVFSHGGGLDDRHSRCKFGFFQTQFGNSTKVQFAPCPQKNRPAENDLAGRTLYPGAWRQAGEPRTSRRCRRRR